MRTANIGKAKRSPGGSTVDSVGLAALKAAWDLATPPDRLAFLGWVAEQEDEA
jgi:hypothetical protein